MGHRGRRGGAARLLGPLLAAAALAAGAAPARETPLVTIGEVTPTGAIVWARAAAAARLVVEAWAPGAPPVTAELHAAPDADLTGRVALTGLTPGTEYRYRVSSASGAAGGRFVTAPPPDAPAPVRLLWSADLGGSGHCPGAGDYPIFRAMAERAPDFFVFAGDTVYADDPCRGDDLARDAADPARDLRGFRAKHRHNRARPAVQAFLATTSVYATWDDHEVDDNFAFDRAPLAAAGLRAFREYWPVASEPDLARRFRWGRLLELFLLDTRFHRDAACDVDGPGKTMLGARQRRWLVDAVAASDARWKVLVSSVPLSISKGWPCGDTWAPRWLFFRHTGFAAERDALLEALARRGVRELVVLAADVHFAAVTTLRPAAGPVVHELIAGPLAARPKSPSEPDARLRPEVRFRRGGVMNFGELSIAGDGLTVRILDGAGRVLATERIAGDPA